MAITLWSFAAKWLKCAPMTKTPELTQSQIRELLARLAEEHRDLDDVIARIAEKVPYDQLQVQRLKKRKLTLKDQIQRLESLLIPDIIA